MNRLLLMEFLKFIKDFAPFITFKESVSFITFIELPKNNFYLFQLRCKNFSIRHNIIELKERRLALKVSS